MEARQLNVTVEALPQIEDRLLTNVRFETPIEDESRRGQPDQKHREKNQPSSSRCSQQSDPKDHGAEYPHRHARGKDAIEQVPRRHSADHKSGSQNSDGQCDSLWR